MRQNAKPSGAGRLRSFIRRQNEALEVETIPLRLSDLPRALVGFRVAVLSDLHFGAPTAYHDRIVAAVAGGGPGLILVAGDTIDNHTRGVAPLTGFFSALSRLAPTVAVLGNNDCAPGRIHSLRDMYAKAGVTLLENETRRLAVPGAALSITGLTDPEAFRRGIHPEREEDERERLAMPDALAPTPAPNGSQPSILLMHQPQLARRYAGLRPSLIVAGHAHGGQIRLPWAGGIYGPGQGLFPRFTSGLYGLGETHMVVSRGLGNHGVPLRLGNRPHLPIVILLR